MKKFLLRSPILILLFVSFVFSHVVIVDAQDDQTEEPVYIVEPGDTLWAISRTFNVSIDDLSKKNGIDDPSQLSVGARLTIPGYEGLQGVLVIKTVPFGETIDSLSKRYKISAANLNRLNRAFNRSISNRGFWADSIRFPLMPGPHCARSLPNSTLNQEGFQTR